MPRYACVHGHFYQPPRENPWLEIVELQESASPWHDWNDRITEECYRRNAASRILDRDGNIRKICNNYSRMSFNIGPTLMSWLKENSHRCYREILDADAAGIERFSGHGPAVAQVYNHLIMPLANRRDKVTQVKWGISDFKSHFGRMPEGMWLAETAVDTETLEVLAENGIRFTILAPNQGGEVRLLKSDNAWRDVRWGGIDTGMAYLCNLPSGKSINLFFYDGMISHDIAFGGLLHDGGAYARHLIDAKPELGGSTLSNVATDGESY
jgi:alpha-amylase/alpha-mannosidase (GH57 family)